MKTQTIKICDCLLFAAFALFGSVTANADTVYVANNGSNFNIMQFTPSGVGSVFANTGINNWALTFDSGGNLYVSSPGNSIEKFSSTGTDLGIFANFGASSLAFDSAGNLYAVDPNANTINKFTPGGVGSVFANTSLSYPGGLAFDSAGNLYVANGNGNNIEKFSSTGIDLGVFAGSGGASPYGLAFDSAGNLYVANNGSGGIVKITPGGVGSVFANISATPVGLTFDSAGNLYATYNAPYNFIEKFSSTGTDLGVFANTGLSNPMGIAIQPGPKLADLQVRNITTTNKKASEDSRITITATVSNTGNAVAGASTTLFLDGITVIGFANTPAIPAGGSVNASVVWHVEDKEDDKNKDNDKGKDKDEGRKDKGTHVIEVRADSTNAVTESDEGNNSAQLTVTVKGN